MIFFMYLPPPPLLLEGGYIRLIKAFLVQFQKIQILKKQHQINMIFLFQHSCSPACVKGWRKSVWVRTTCMIFFKKCIDFQRMHQQFRNLILRYSKLQLLCIFFPPVIEVIRPPPSPPLLVEKPEIMSFATDIFHKYQYL